MLSKNWSLIKTKEYYKVFKNFKFYIISFLEFLNILI